MRDKNLYLVGQRIRSFRKAQGMSQMELAERMEMHLNSIGQIERGEQAASIRTIIAIAQALAVHPAQLFEGCAFEQVSPRDPT